MLLWITKSSQGPRRCCARFARDCMHRMHQLTRKLEVLGPDTADLSMRFGPTVAQ
jgi:hypothetical protein